VPLAGGSLYRSVVPLESGEVGADVARYLLQSEQVPSAVGLGVFVERDGRVGAAGGWLVQAMPGAPPATVERLADGVDAAAPSSDLVRRGLGPLDMLAAVVPGVPLDVVDERPVRFRCRCARRRFLETIAALGRARLDELLAGDRHAEVVCEFCGARYRIEEPELRALLDGVTPAPRS
jgi:molecular chaperone Hsp33